VLNKTSQTQKTNTACSCSCVETKAKEKPRHEHKWGTTFGQNQWEMEGERESEEGKYDPSALYTCMEI
jgi:hypothetical protein